MPALKIELKVSDNYSLYMTCHAHGWKNLAPFDWDKDTLTFAAYADKVPTDINVRQKNNMLESDIVSAKKLNSGQVENLKRSLMRSLSTDTDTSELKALSKNINPQIARLIDKGAGRLLRAPSLWEDAAKTLFTTNCSWSLTQKMCEAICSPNFSEPTSSGNYPFPKPENIIQYSTDELKGLMPIGYRADFFLSLAKHFIQDPYLCHIESNGCKYTDAYSIVNQLKGFGEYSTNHVLVLCGYYGEIPIDSVVISYLKRNYRVRKPSSFIKRHYQKWGKYKWWGLKLEKMLAHQNWLGD